MKRSWNTRRKFHSESNGDGGTAVMESDRERGSSAAPDPSARRAQRGARGEGEPWVVVLAGGEGHRLRAFTTLRDGVVVPKQFCRFRDERTLLATTLDRALRITRRDRVIVVVLEAHREWWEPEISRLPERNVLRQPAGRGTAVAILHATVHIHMRDTTPRIVVMPSDHDVDNEDALVRTLERGTRLADMYPGDLVLLGIAPSHLDAEYGLIVPGPGTGIISRPVRAFIEKPTLTVASQLIRGGALWNSFIFACTGGALYDAFEAALPALARSYLQGLATGGGNDAALAALFEELPARDFCREVLERNASRLRLVTVPECGWTDLGTPARLAAWLDRHREAPFWREHGVPRLNGTDGLGGTLQAGCA